MDNHDNRDNSSNIRDCDRDTEEYTPEQIRQACTVEDDETEMSAPEPGQRRGPAQPYARSAHRKSMWTPK